MADDGEGYGMGQGRGRPPAWAVAVFALAAVCAAVLLVVGSRNGDDPMRTAGLLGLLAAGLLAPVVLSPSRGGSGTAMMSRRLEELAESIQRLGDQQALSPDARRVLSRRRDRDVLRQAIEEDLQQGDWAAAEVLIDELAERFGYRAEAEDFRRRVEQARSATLDERITDAIRRLDAMIVRLQWEEARAEAERIRRMFPDVPRTAGVRERVEKARLRYKSELERRFLVAAREERAEEAMQFLKELDGYLTEQEAEPYVELARGVVGKAKENLGVQFKLAVQDRDWQRAADTGERIIRDFPNTRMAEEIRGIIDTIRHRAAQAQIAQTQLGYGGEPTLGAFGPGFGSGV